MNSFWLSARKNSPSIRFTIGLKNKRSEDSIVRKLYLASYFSLLALSGQAERAVKYTLPVAA